MSGRPQNTIEKILSRIEKIPDSCWIWTGGVHPCGYGTVGYLGRNHYVHRLVYEQLVWPVGEGLELDHLCRNKVCCNPLHLEEVTHAENCRRGNAGLYMRVKTHCVRGHSFNEGNTRWHQGFRRCRKCAIIATRHYRARKKANA